MNDGISLTQPPHLVAQRSNRTDLPLNSDSDTGLPRVSRNTKLGAILRADCGSTGTRMSAAWTSDNAASVRIMVRMGPLSLRRCTIIFDKLFTSSTVWLNRKGMWVIGASWGAPTGPVVGADNARLVA